MTTFWFEIILILVLILANGFFAGAELAIVSVRRSRILKLAADGNRRAALVASLKNDPHRFLATVQIGVTLVATMASAIGGATAATAIEPIFAGSDIAFVSEYASFLAIVIVVGLISYLSLVIGELVPKALAIQYAEKIALGVAGPIRLLAAVAGVAVWFLTISSRAVLALFGMGGQKENAFITKDEIQHLVAEGRESGAVTKGEQEFIRNAFAFTRTKVREVMVPRTRVVGLDLDKPRQDILETVKENRFSRYPVFRDRMDNIIGFIHAKDLLGEATEDTGFDVAYLVRDAFFVPETNDAGAVLRDMQKKRLHIAMVVDEYGGFSGVVTIEDLLEELVGEIEDEHDSSMPRRVQRLDNGGFLADGLISLKDLKELTGMSLPEEPPYDTLAGLILFELGHLPKRGESLVVDDVRLTCVKVSRTAILMVRIDPPADESE